jgi:putative transposase
MNKTKKGTKEYRKIRDKFRDVHRQVSNCRNDFLHKLSAHLVSKYGKIVTEKLRISEMLQDKSSAGLHISIKDSGWYTFLTMLRYKSEEAKTEVVELETRELKPSQRCPECWGTKKKALEDRIHICEVCGFECDRDVAAAKVMVKEYLGLGTDLLKKRTSHTSENSSNKETFTTLSLRSKLPPVRMVKKISDSNGTSNKQSCVT